MVADSRRYPDQPRLFVSDGHSDGTCVEATTQLLRYLSLRDGSRPPGSTYPGSVVRSLWFVRQRRPGWVLPGVRAVGLVEPTGAVSNLDECQPQLYGR